MQKWRLQAYELELGCTAKAVMYMMAYVMQQQTDLPAGMEVRPTQMRPFMKVPVVSTTALHWKVMPKNVLTPAQTLCTYLQAFRAI